MAVFAVVIFVATPGEPWEDLSLVGLAAMAGAWKWLTVVVAEQAGYVVFIFGGLASWTGPFGYLVALVASLLATAASWRSRIVRPWSIASP
jgi:hypothetical protein